jgi:LPPG:FO 2-phospho-L-lactate transferase
MLYALSDTLDIRKGWGVKEDTFNLLKQAAKLGLEDWFKLGDKDLALHIIRTELMKKGFTLSEVVKKISGKMNIHQTIIPASNQKIETMIKTKQRTMHLQEFWVKLKGKPEVNNISYYSSEKPQPAPGVLDAIQNSRKIIICPANPITSIGPIISISGIKSAMKKFRRKVTAVSPILGNEPFSGPAGKFMRALAIPVSPIGIAMYYSGIIGKLVIDNRDATYFSRINELGIAAISTNINMDNVEKERSLAYFLIN